MNQYVEPNTRIPRVKRRRFLALLGGIPILGSLGVPAARALETDDAAMADQKVPPIDSRHAALLVMDYQNAWIATLSDPDPLLSREVKTISIARQHGVRVAYTFVAFTPADYAAVSKNNIIFTGLTSKPGALDEGSKRMAIDGRVAPRRDDKVVRKTRVGAFDRTDLDQWLRDLSIDTLILSGISTSGVVLSTVCDAADRDYRLVVVSDACADTVPQIQDTLMHKVFPQRAQIVTHADLPRLLVHRRGSAG
jgi:nicotinamidase-related amidase